MGKVFSIFRRKKSTYEVLSCLDEKITDLENYTFSTREQQKNFAGRFVVGSLGVFIIGFIIFYLYFYPPTWKERLLYSSPLLAFPFIVIIIKYCVSWYFETNIQRNNRNLYKLKEEKKNILENVMNKETYKVALDILNTFGDKSMKPKSSLNVDLSTTASTNQSLVLQRTPIRNTQNQQQMTPRLGQTPVRAGAMTPMSANLQVRSVQSNANPNAIVKATPFPIIDKTKQNYMEKMIDFIISDGPANRFAMICSNCYGHNGMALQEDFEYMAFKCAFCNVLNPARKIRPKAQSLLPPPQSDANNSSRDAISDEDSSDDSADETVLKVGKKLSMEIKDEPPLEAAEPSNEVEDVEMTEEKGPDDKKNE